MKAMKKKQSFFENRSVVAVFGILALFAGFSFIQPKGVVTGNAVLSARYGVSFLSIIGILLLICSMVLIAYSIVKKE